MFIKIGIYALYCTLLLAGVKRTYSDESREKRGFFTSKIKNRISQAATKVKNYISENPNVKTASNIISQFKALTTKDASVDSDRELELQSSIVDQVEEDKNVIVPLFTESLIRQLSRFLHIEKGFSISKVDDETILDNQNEDDIIAKLGDLYENNDEKSAVWCFTAFRALLSKFTQQAIDGFRWKLQMSSADTSLADTITQMNTVIKNVLETFFDSNENLDTIVEENIASLRDEFAKRKELAGETSLIMAERKSSTQTLFLRGSSRTISQNIISESCNAVNQDDELLSLSALEMSYSHCLRKFTLDIITNMKTGDVSKEEVLAKISKNYVFEAAVQRFRRWSEFALNEGLYDQVQLVFSALQDLRSHVSRIKNGVKQVKCKTGTTMCVEEVVKSVDKSISDSEVVTGFDFV